MAPAELPQKVIEDAERIWFKEIRELALTKPEQASARALCFDAALDLLKNIIGKYYVPKLNESAPTSATDEPISDTQTNHKKQDMAIQVEIIEPLKVLFSSTLLRVKWPIPIFIFKRSIPNTTAIDWATFNASGSQKGAIIYIIIHQNWNCDETLAVFEIFKQKLATIKAIIPADRSDANIFQQKLAEKNYQTWTCSDANEVIKVLLDEGFKMIPETTAEPQNGSFSNETENPQDSAQVFHEILHNPSTNQQNHDNVENQIHTDKDAQNRTYEAINDRNDPIKVLIRSHQTIWSRQIRTNIVKQKEHYNEKKSFLSWSKRIIKYLPKRCIAYIIIPFKIKMEDLLAAFKFFKDNSIDVKVIIHKNILNAQNLREVISSKGFEACVCSGAGGATKYLQNEEFEIIPEQQVSPVPYSIPRAEKYLVIDENPPIWAQEISIKHIKFISNQSSAYQWASYVSIKWPKNVMIYIIIPSFWNFEDALTALFLFIEYSFNIKAIVSFDHQKANFMVNKLLDNGIQVSICSNKDELIQILQEPILPVIENSVEIPKRLYAGSRPYWSQEVQFNIRRGYLPPDQAIIKWAERMARLNAEDLIVYIIIPDYWNKKDYILIALLLLKEASIIVNAIIPSERMDAKVLKQMISDNGMDAFICSNANEVVKIFQDQEFSEVEKAIESNISVISESNNLATKKPQISSSSEASAISQTIKEPLASITQPEATALIQPESLMIAGENHPSWAQNIQFNIHQKFIPSYESPSNWMESNIPSLSNSKTIIYFIISNYWNSADILNALTILDEKRTVTVKPIIPADRYDAHLLKALLSGKNLDVFICSNENELIELFKSEEHTSLSSNEVVACLNDTFDGDESGNSDSPPRKRHRTSSSTSSEEESETSMEIIDPQTETNALSVSKNVIKNFEAENPPPTNCTIKVEPIDDFQHDGDVYDSIITDFSFATNDAPETINDASMNLASSSSDVIEEVENPPANLKIKTETNEETF